jgi:hypothetical protein
MKLPSQEKDTRTSTKPAEKDHPTRWPPADNTGENATVL